LLALIIHSIIQNLTGENLEGTVIGQEERWDDLIVYYPIIEYYFLNTKQQFQSAIYAHKPFRIGDQVKLIRHVNSGEVERSDIGAAFMGAICLLFLALLWMCFGLVIVFPNFTFY